MITGLRGASIWSEDMKHPLPFYRDVLGFVVTVEIPGFVERGGLWLGTLSEVRGHNADPVRHMVGLATTTDCTRLKTADVEFIEDSTDYGALRLATGQ